MTTFYLVESQQTVFSSDGENLKIRPQSYQVFSFLIDNENTIVSKEQLFDNVWKSTTVTDDSITQCIADIRRILGTEHKHLLQTIPKKGYRISTGGDGTGHQIIEKVETIPAVAGATNELGQTEIFVEKSQIEVPSHDDIAKKGPLGLIGSVSRHVKVWWSQPFQRQHGLWIACASILLLVGGLWSLYSIASRDESNKIRSGEYIGPSIVVFPFKSKDPRNQTNYFSEGVSADIVYALTRFSNLRVLSFSTVAGYQEDNERFEKTLEDFNAQYALSGSVWRSDNRVRLNIELTDTQNGHLLWSQKYDEVIGDVFTLQDKIARRVVTSLSVSLTEIETERAFKSPTGNMIAYDYVLTGRSKFHLRNRKDNNAARQLFNRAIQLDSEYVQAYIALGETYVEEAMFGYSEWPDDALATALKLAKSAVQLDERNPQAIGFLAKVYFRLDKFELAKKELNRALEINPSDPELYVLNGLLLSRDGQVQKAIENLEYARLFDPEIKSGWTELGGLYFLEGRVDEAILTYERGLAVIPHITYVHVMLTASYAENGNLEKARESATRVRQFNPFFDSMEFSQYSLFRTDNQRKRLLDALEKAGFD